MNTKKILAVTVLILLIILALVLISRRKQVAFLPTQLNVASTPQGEIGSLTLNSPDFIAYHQLNNGGVIGYSKTGQQMIAVDSESARNLINITRTPSTMLASQDNSHAVLSFDNSTSFIKVELESGQSASVPTDTLATTWNKNQLVRLIQTDQTVYVLEEGTEGPVSTGIKHQPANQYKIIASDNYYAIQYGPDDQDFPSHRVSLIERANNNQVKELPINSALSIKWTPDQRYLVDSVLSADIDNTSVLYYNLATGQSSVITGNNLSGSPLTALPDNKYLHVGQLSTEGAFLWQITIVDPRQAKPVQSFTIEVPATDYVYYFYFHENNVYGVNRNEIVSVPLSYIIANARN